VKKSLKKRKESPRVHGCHREYVNATLKSYCEKPHSVGTTWGAEFWVCHKTALVDIQDDQMTNARREKGDGCSIWPWIFDKAHTPLIQGAGPRKRRSGRRVINQEQRITPYCRFVVIGTCFSRFHDTLLDGLKPLRHSSGTLRVSARNHTVSIVLPVRVSPTAPIPELERYRIRYYSNAQVHMFTGRRKRNRRPKKWYRSSASDCAHFYRSGALRHT
jgi:hypothetical protein